MIAVVTAAVMLPVPLFAGPRSANETELSAALTLRIAKFIEWPSRSILSEDRPYFIVGVMGTVATQSAFAAFDGKFIKGKKIKTVRVDPSTDLRDLRRCHIVFADASSDRKVLAEMTRRSKGVLTVFGPRGVKKGGHCLSLVRQGSQLAFDIDLQCTRRGEFEVDAGLIRLAREVRK